MLSQAKNQYCSRQPYKRLGLYSPADIQAGPDQWELEHGYSDLWTTAGGRKRRGVLENLPVKRSRMWRLTSSKRHNKKPFKKIQGTGQFQACSPKQQVVEFEPRLKWRWSTLIRWKTVLCRLPAYWCPAILPRKHCLTRLIVKSYTEKGNHAAGNNHTLSLLSARFWIMQGREEICDWERECCECLRERQRPPNR